MHSYIRPRQFVAIQLPSDQIRITKIVPNTIVQLGKYGSFAANQVLGRPFHLTFELLDAPEPDGYRLRVVSATELHAETLIEEAEGEEGEADDALPTRTNQNIVDDGSAQKLTVQEIEELKKEAGGAGKEIIARILESHSGIDQKTAFSLAKYTLRKRKKFIRRFSIVPLDVSTLAHYLMTERDAAKTMELRDEHIGLLGCLANVHHGGNLPVNESNKPNGRYFVVDETGGLVVAAMAERMGILYPPDEEDEDQDEDQDELPIEEPSGTDQDGQAKAKPQPRRASPRAMSATGNSITVVHAYSQPNLTLLKYFGYDTVSWLQLVDPLSDPIYANKPESRSAEEVASLKTNKRTIYYHKIARWERVKSVTDEARAGGFDGLVVATLLEPPGVLKTLVPLLAGSASVSVYSPYIEPLVDLVDLYSTARRTSFIYQKRDIEAETPEGEEPDLSVLFEEFKVDPTLLLPPSLQTTRVRAWQVLPGRTHPLMSARGGAEGYLFHASRVIPTKENIRAAGTFRKKRKLESTSTPNNERDVVMRT
ncbi:hypothetical protein N7470_006459 [Penicillium chermesinum]|nr:hypothetical protein N7470_006459 [Penicillium chermesinum]